MLAKTVDCEKGTVNEYYLEQASEIFVNTYRACDRYLYAQGTPENSIPCVCR
jgi:hypothetical protein